MGVQCDWGESVFEAARRAYGSDAVVVLESGPCDSPKAEGMIGTVAVRHCERFAVVRRTARAAVPTPKTSEAPEGEE